MSNLDIKNHNTVKMLRGKKKPQAVEMMAKIEELNILLLDKESEINAEKVYVSELKLKLERLEKDFQNEKSKYEKIYSDAIEAQKVRANHWRKYEVESLKNEFIINELIHLANILNNQERTLSLALGRVIIGLIKGEITLDKSISLISDSYFTYLKKVNPSQIDTNLMKIENVINSLADNNRIKIISKIPLVKKALYKLNEKLITDEYLTSFFNGDDIKKIILNEAKEFKNIIEKKAIAQYELSQKNFQKENLKNSDQTKIIKNPSKLKVAVIFDEFTYECFKYEFDCCILEPNNWKDVFEKNKPEIFFCESAWSGVDSKRRPWKGQIYASINFVKENRKALLEILDYCNKNNIPTVFWNKEDPTHYDDEVHSFTKTANLFDYIFTVSEECVEKYKKDFNRENVFVLPFATQPKIFNPITEKERKANTVTFAGSWYANHDERSQDMTNILNFVLSAKKDLIVYDRFYGTDDLNHIFPDSYKKYIRPGVPFKDIDKVYKESDMSLTINTVKDSSTMIARRAFELMSCNTLVLSNTSLGMDSLFKDLYLDIEASPNLLIDLNEHEIQMIKNRALSEVLKKHTYRMRWKNILNSISYKYLEEEKTLTYCFIVDKNLCVDEVIFYFNKYKLKNSKLLLILDESIDNSNISKYFCEYSSHMINVISKHYIKNYCKDLSCIINSTHFMMLDINDENIWLNSDKILMHYEYLGNELISLTTNEHCKFIRNMIVKNIVAPADKFSSLLEKYNKEYSDKAYCLNIVNV